MAVGALLFLLIVLIFFAGIGVKSVWHDWRQANNTNVHSLTISNVGKTKVWSD